jgi:hypothetical protein
VLFSFFLYAGIHLILILSPSYVFSEVFGFKPPQEISELQSKVSYDYTYIRFKASPSVIEKLLAQNFHEITRKEFVENLKACDFDFGIGAPPDWWKPLDGNLEKFYENKILINDSFLSCDELTGVVSFYWVHID